jgi:Zn/Cd-binding protein ZinT
MPRVLPIHFVEGNVAPRYDTGYETQVERVTITEQGTQANLPIVDFIAKDKAGNQVCFVLTGREVCTLAAAIRGVNTRIHGVPEP